MRCASVNQPGTTGFDVPVAAATGTSFFLPNISSVHYNLLFLPAIPRLSTPIAEHTSTAEGVSCQTAAHSLGTLHSGCGALRVWGAHTNAHTNAHVRTHECTHTCTQACMHAYLKLYWQVSHAIEKECKTQKTIAQHVARDAADALLLQLSIVSGAALTLVSQLPILENVTHSI